MLSRLGFKAAARALNMAGTRAMSSEYTKVYASPDEVNEESETP